MINDQGSIGVLVERIRVALVCGKGGDDYGGVSVHERREVIGLSRARRGVRGKEGFRVCSIRRCHHLWVNNEQTDGLGVVVAAVGVDDVCIHEILPLFLSES